jgi:hypothetical protein
MGTVINPIFSGAVPGMNPTGNQLALNSPNSSLTGLPSGANSMLPNTSLSPNSVGSGNPYDAVPGAPPSFPANTGGGYGSSLNLTPTTGSGGGTITPGALPGTPGGPQNTTQMAQNSPFSFLQAMTPKDISRMFSDLKGTYGDGMAHMILDFLTSGAGFNQQAINNLLASLQPGIERGTESMMSQFSASGNRFGSGAQIGLGDYLSQVNLNEGQLVTQMYEQSLNNFMNVMMGIGDTTAKAHMNSPSPLDAILGGAGLATAAGDAVSSIIGTGGSGIGALAALVGI